MTQEGEMLRWSWGRGRGSEAARCLALYSYKGEKPAFKIGAPCSTGPAGGSPGLQGVILAATVPARAGQACVASQRAE